MNVLDLLNPAVDRVRRAGELLSAEWHRTGGPRGHGDKAVIDSQIEVQLRLELLNLLDCDFWGEETGSHMAGHEFCWVVDAPITLDLGEDCIYWAEGQTGLMRNGQSVHAPLGQLTLQPGSAVLVSTAAAGKPELNAELCAPAEFIPMPSVAYRLARAAAGDALVGTSLVPVSAHDVVGGHALLIGAGGVLLNQDGEPVSYESEDRMREVCSRCFGGAPQACRELATRDWSRLFQQS